MTTIYTANVVIEEPVKPRADWSVIGLPGVSQRITWAANHVGNAYSSITSVDDQRQEAYLLLATNADRVRSYVGLGELEHLFVWLRSRLIDKVRVEANRINQHVSMERLRESCE
ncbi:hypothetical protein FHR83_007136 [Actinoplanes campanulatus]|uniref:Uncharacterized protein n=1 Tax=Actinoplanes campanulatus TaxID=113559 RepID=A0A7W5FIF6_9ACTN|nr:hypothetical protein [Actinoplanes campanulatus]MBB3099430.1 hypothetical protein [Actinoplanes campanulatus]GGN40031.1 hypothetical protein GCM10010109_68550 [Actinoplanes campanulatus]GID42360.1 hypothetical protein Aca09nite_88660 [Actinoplanes campanulatus]